MNFNGKDIKEKLKCYCSISFVALCVIVSQIMIQYIYAFIIYFRNLSVSTSYVEALSPAIKAINNNSDLFSLTGMIFCSFWLYCRYFRRRGSLVIKLAKVNYSQYIMAVVFGIAFASLTYAGLSLITYEYNVCFSYIFTGVRFAMYIFIVCLFAPIFEEVVFRIIITQKLQKSFSNIHTIIVQAILFSLIHSDMKQIVYTFFLGIVLGILMVKTNNIIIPCIIHIIFNMLGMIVFPIVNFSKQQLYVLFFMSFSICIITFFIEKRKNKKCQ